MAVRRIVELEGPVDHTLGLLAEGRGISVEELLVAAARHVARTMGGLRQPVYRLAPRDIELPDLDAPPPAPPVPTTPKHRPSPASLAKLDEAVRLYRDERLSLIAVAGRTGLSAPTVRRLLEHAQIPIRPQGGIPGMRLGGERA